MKTLKQLVLGLGILAGGLASAQSANMTNMLKVGVIGGASTGGNTSANVGLDLSYQNIITPGFGLGIATGYNHYFGKNATLGGVDVKNHDFGVIPVAALFRVYPKQTGFYFGADLGYGFIVGDDKVTNSNVATLNNDRPDGGFYIKPEIGYHNRDWNFFVQYNKTFTGDRGKVLDQNYNAGAIGVGFGYNIPLGK